VTYRVVSADGHPVSGGLTFQVGETAAVPRSVETLLQGTSAGPVSRAALGIARGLGYLAIAVALGGVAFLAFCWRPAVRGEAALTPAGAAFEARLARLVGLGVVLGIVAGAAAVVLQAAVAGETSAWTALDPSVVREVLGTRTGLWLGVRVAAWAVLAWCSPPCGRGRHGRWQRSPRCPRPSSSPARHSRVTPRRRARSPCSRRWTSCTWLPPRCGSAAS
jgi:copper transport protein